jgi:streptomycin 3"-adenylyltransferase
VTEAEPEQISAIVAGLKRALGDRLVGVYLHGSLVLGCFNPQRSDVDVLVITTRRLEAAERDAVVMLVRRETGSWQRAGWPRPVELTSLALGDLRPWRYPTPYDVHVSSSSPDGAGPGEDHDLAAHIWILRRHGRALVGAPVGELFPEVPDQDYLDSIGRDFDSCRDEGYEWPRYAILSMARVWAARTTGEVHSKETAAEWALPRLPEDVRPLLARALESYRGDGADFPVDRAEFDRLAGFVDGQLR